MTEINQQTFEQEVLQSTIPVLVDFWAPWCGPCKRIKPNVEEVGAHFGSKLKIVGLDINNGSEAPLVVQYDIRAIPLLVLVYQGKEIGRLAGLFSAKEIIDWVTPILPAAVA